MDKLIRCNFGSGSSSQVTSAPGVRDGPWKATVSIEEPSTEEEVAPSQATAPDSVLEKSSCKGSSYVSFAFLQYFSVAFISLLLQFCCSWIFYPLPIRGFLTYDMYLSLKDFIL